MSTFKVEVTLSPEQLKELAVLIASESGQSNSAYRAPLPLAVAAKELGRSERTIRRRIAAGLIQTVKGDKNMIPRSEIERHQQGGNGK
jgi:hypothetical protein